MAGFRDFGLHYRKRSTPLAGADTDHIVLFADVTGDTFFIDENGNITSLRLNNAYISGFASISGDLFVNGSASISGDATVQQDLLVKEDISVWGRGYIGEDLEVDSFAKIDQTLEVGGDISGNSSLYVLENIWVDGNLDINGTVNFGSIGTASGNFQFASDVDVGGTFTVDNDAFFNSNVSVSGNHTILGDLIINGNVGIIGGLTVDSLGTISGDVYFTDNFEVQGNSYFIGDIETDGQLDVYGDALFQEDVQINSTLTVDANALFKQDVTIYANTTIDGVLSVSGNGTFYSNIDMKQNLNVDGSVNIEIDARVDRDLVVHRDVTIDRNLFVEGIVNFDSIAVIDNDLHVGQDIYAHDDLYVEDFAQISGGVHIINLGKNNTNGLHRNENPIIGSEPEDSSDHSILWVQGNTVCLSGGSYKTYLQTIENEDNGGFLRCVNPDDFDVVTISQTCSNGDGVIEIFDLSGGSTLFLTGDRTAAYQLEVTGNAYFTGEIHADDIQTDSIQVGETTQLSEIVTLSGSSWVELSISAQRGTAVLMVAGVADDTPAATFMTASSSISGAGIVNRIVSSSASEGDELEARWFGSSNIEIRKDALTPTNDGLYTVSIIRIGE